MHFSIRRSRRRGICALLAMSGIAIALGCAAHDDTLEPLEPVSPEAEALIHTAPGAAAAGEPRVAGGDTTAVIQLRVLDAATGEPAFCRVNVIGPDGNYYEPAEHAQKPWSLERLGNRKEKGPFRYYGWFFYCDGEEEVRVPAGECTIEVWKGIEYRPVRQRVTVEAGAPLPVELALTRTLDLAAEGWYSGDPHIHLNRRDETDEARALDLIAAEDIRYGFLLGMNDAKTFNGVPEDQEWPQLRGMGRASIAQRGGYTASSGYEYRNSTFGHILLLMADDLIFRDQILKVDEWPTFAEVGKAVHDLNGVAFHAHGGYEKEIYADYVTGATDGVELLQFAVYRGIGLAGWYHILNAGYRFPAVGASDFPYCRALGDCRTYVRMEGDPSMEEWLNAAVAGESFVTTGPVLSFTVNGAGPGGTVMLEDAADSVEVTVLVRSEVAPVTDIECIANGQVVRHFRIDQATRAYDFPQKLSYRFKVPLTGSTWFAARACGEQVKGLPDAEAHTNPVFVIRGGAPIRNDASVDWLLAKLDERTAAIEAMADFERKTDVLAFFRECRLQLAARKAE